MSGVNSSIFVLTSADLASGALVPLPVGAELTKVFVNLGTAGSTASTVTVNKNGAAVSTAVATVASTATKGNAVVVNPYIGVNAAAGAWTDQNQATVPYPASAGGVNNVLPLASFAAGDNVSVTVALGTSAATPTYTLVFEVK
jgi:hypothetical protein